MKRTVSYFSILLAGAFLVLLPVLIHQSDNSAGNLMEAAYAAGIPPGLGSPTTEPLGAANMRYYIEQQKLAGMSGRGPERTPPDWALPYLRGETQVVSMPEPVPLGK